MKNIQSQAIEMFCVYRNLSPPIMNNIFTQKNKTLREKYPNTNLNTNTNTNFWSVFSCIRIRNNSLFGHLSRSDSRYNLRQISEYSRPLVKSLYHESESVSFLRPKIWDMVSEHCKDIDNLNTFKNKVK